jgi:hypothetical protein
MSVGICMRSEKIYMSSVYSWAFGLIQTASLRTQHTRLKPKSKQLFVLFQSGGGLLFSLSLFHSAFSFWFPPCALHSAPVRRLFQYDIAIGGNGRLLSLLLYVVVRECRTLTHTHTLGTALCWCNPQLSELSSRTCRAVILLRGGCSRLFFSSRCLAGLLTGLACLSLSLSLSFVRSLVNLYISLSLPSSIILRDFISPKPLLVEIFYC